MIIDDILGDGGPEREPEPKEPEANRGPLYEWNPPLTPSQIAWIESMWISREWTPIRGGN